MSDLEKKNPGEVEFLQAVREVLESIQEVYNENRHFEFGEHHRKDHRARPGADVQGKLGGRQWESLGKPGLPGSVQQCHWTV